MHPSDHSGPAGLVASRTPAFIGLLFASMGAATLPMSAIGVLATFIIDGLEISRAVLGWIVSTNVILAAVLSPVAGHITDVVGGRRAIALTLTTSGAAFVMFGTAPALWVMFLASTVAAVSQATGNPATNLLIRVHLPEGRRGIATGMKQSGVQAAATAGGLALPSLALAFGWGTAMVLISLLPFTCLLTVLWLIPRSDGIRQAPSSERIMLPRSVRWLAVYGLTFGFAGASTFYVPLYVEEAVGFDPRIAGVTAAVIGAVAFTCRILWARLAERSDRYLRPLWLMAVGGVVAATLMQAGASWSWLIWPGALAIGASSSAWNSVGMLAVINKTGATTGRASGVVVFGFLIGLGIGPPLYGATIDATGAYTAMWIIALGASAVSAAIISIWQRRPGEVWPTSENA